MTIKELSQQIGDRYMACVLQIERPHSKRLAEFLALKKLETEQKRLRLTRQAEQTSQLLATRISHPRIQEHISLLQKREDFLSGVKVVNTTLDKEALIKISHSTIFDCCFKIIAVPLGEMPDEETLRKIRESADWTFVEIQV